MDATADFPDPMTLDSSADLQTVLAAWHGATLRLEQTHAALRAEVCRLTDELEIKNRELARKNRLADLGQMASHIAHEVRNNLVPVSLYVSVLRRRIADDAESLDVVNKINSGLLSLDSTVNDLLHFTSDRDPHLGTVLLKSLVDDVLGSLAPQLAAQRIRTQVRLAQDCRLVADSGMLRRAMLNLALNAIDAMPQGGSLTVSAAETADAIALEVADSGAGLSEEVCARAFEPFFTTKSHGTGLGLAIVDRIAAVHGGEVLAANGPAGGAVFTLRLPHTAAEPRERAA